RGGRWARRHAPPQGRHRDQSDAAAESVPARRAADGAWLRLRLPPRPGVLGCAARPVPIRGPAPAGGVRGRGPGRRPLGPVLQHGTRGRRRRRVALRRRPALRPEPLADPGHGRQGEVRRRGPGTEMKRRPAAGLASWVAAAGLGLFVAGAASCGSKAEAPRGSRVSVRWTGADTASFSASAVAEWCAALHLVEIRAVAGDTGVGIALYPPDTIDAGMYPIRRPDGADTTRQRSAAVALRWFSKTTVMGFQGDSGSLTLERRSDGTLGG